MSRKFTQAEVQAFTPLQAEIFLNRSMGRMVDGDPGWLPNQSTLVQWILYLIYNQTPSWTNTYARYTESAGDSALAADYVTTGIQHDTSGTREQQIKALLEYRVANDLWN